MKSVVVYWIAGCIMIGFGIGQLIIKCPSQKFSAPDILLAVATWPAAIGYAFSGAPLRAPASCEAPTN